MISTSKINTLIEKSIELNGNRGTFIMIIPTRDSDLK